MTLLRFHEVYGTEFTMLQFLDIVMRWSSDKTTTQALMRFA